MDFFYAGYVGKNY